MADELSCILVALARERLFFPPLGGCRRLADAPCPAWMGRWPGGRGLLVQTGMGPAAVERALGWVRGLGRARFLLAGFCGALADDLEVGCLVQPTEVCDEQGAICPLAAGPRLAPGVRLLNVAAPVLGVVQRRALRQRSGAAVVDMESATAARWAAEQGVAFTCLRAVSDDAQHELPAELNEALAGGQVQPWRLAAAVLRRPGLAWDLGRLARQSRVAARVLADGVRRWLAQVCEPTSSPAG